MSLGYIGICRKVAEDDYIVMYSYAGENWNDGGKSKHGDSQLQDGLFTIRKDTFSDNLNHCLQTGTVKIDQACKNAFQKSDISCDYIAWRLLRHILKDYQRNLSFPEKASFIQ